MYIKGEFIVAITHATNETFQEAVDNGVTLVDFWAPWCGPCKMVAPVLDELDGALAEGAKIMKVNVDEEGELAARFGIMSIPALVVFKDGQVVDQTVGYQPKEVLEDLVNKHI